MQKPVPVNIVPVLCQVREGKVACKGMWISHLRWQRPIHVRPMIDDGFLLSEGVLMGHTRLQSADSVRSLCLGACWW